MIKCDRCRKKLEAEDGTRIIGAKIEVIFPDYSHQAGKELMIKSLGGYASYLKDVDGELKFSLCLCWECYLDSLLQGHRENLIYQFE